MNTKEWLNDSLIWDTKDDTVLIKNGVSWIHVAGFTRCGCIFAIYKNENNYCVHASDEWNEGTEPNMGYYNISLTRDELINEIANTYDAIRKRHSIKNNI